MKFKINSIVYDLVYGKGIVAVSSKSALRVDFEDSKIESIFYNSEGFIFKTNVVEDIVKYKETITSDFKSLLTEEEYLELKDLEKKLKINPKEDLLSSLKESFNSKRDIVIDLRRGYSFNLDKKILFFRDKVVKLSETEKYFLAYLIANRNTVMTYERIQEDIWLNKDMTIDNLRTVVANLKFKTYRELIVNHKTVGYSVNIED